MRLGLLFGGKSAEHEVSLQSARTILKAIDRSKYDVVLIGIDKKGLWHLCKEDLQFGKGIPFLKACSEILTKIDIAFPVLHGPYGEDGTLQGVFEVAGIPYVGAGVLGSAVGMDKDVMKRLLRDAGIPIADFLVFHEEPSFREVITELGLPCFIKPANLGSSIGVTKATNEKEFYDGIELAFSYDSKILIERQILGRELEVSVLGLNSPIASLPGEVIVKKEFYTYEAKYFKEANTEFMFPAVLPSDKCDEIRELAIKTFEILCCESMARVDFFMTPSGEFIVNEINTIPGFTPLSPYPKLWEVSGIDTPELVQHLINFALNIRSVTAKNLL